LYTQATYGHEIDLIVVTVYLTLDAAAYKHTKQKKYDG